MEKNYLRKICECGILVAMAFALSLIKIPQIFGGAVTAASMVPLVVASYRNGTLWGLGSAFVFSVIKLVMGFENFSYVTGIASILAVLFFDYLLAYTAVGIAGIFKPSRFDSRGTLTLKASLGAFIGMLLRYACHVVSGAVVWYDLTKVWEASDPTNIVFRYGKWAYSAVYNGTYMLPETVITVAVSAVLAASVGKSLISKKSRT